MDASDLPAGLADEFEDEPLQLSEPDIGEV